MEGKTFKFDIPEERRKKIEELTNEPVEGTAYDTYHFPFQNLKNAYDGRINQKELEEKRLEYIDDAIRNVIARNKSVIKAKQSMMEKGWSEEKIKKAIWTGLSWEINMELENLLAPDSFTRDLENPELAAKIARRFNHEFPDDVVEKRFLEWDFVNEDEVPEANNGGTIKNSAEK